MIHLIKLKILKDDLDKTDRTKECKICYHNFFNNDFKPDLKICNKCNWGIESFENFPIIITNGIRYIFFMFDMTEEEVIKFIKGFELDEL